MNKYKQIYSKYWLKKISFQYKHVLCFLGNNVQIFIRIKYTVKNPLCGK